MFSEERLSKIRSIKQQVEADLLALPDVTGVDIGYKMVGGEKTDQLAIRVYVRIKKNVSAKNTVPKLIQGVPTDVIERSYVLHTGPAGEGEHKK